MQIVLFGVPSYSRVRLSSQSGFRLGRQPAGAARPARAESLPCPELVEEDAGGRVVLVVADPEASGWYTSGRGLQARRPGTLPCPATVGPAGLYGRALLGVLGWVVRW